MQANIVVDNRGTYLFLKTPRGKGIIILLYALEKSSEERNVELAGWLQQRPLTPIAFFAPKIYVCVCSIVLHTYIVSAHKNHTVNVSVYMHCI